MTNNGHVIVTKGFYRVFDLENHRDKTLLKNFLENFQKRNPQKEQKMIKEELLQPQSLNKIEIYPELLQANIIHTHPLSYISDDPKVREKVNKGHVLVDKEGNINLNAYNDTKNNYHKIAMNNKNLPDSVRHQNSEIYNAMDFACKLSKYIPKKMFF